VIPRQAGAGVTMDFRKDWIWELRKPVTVLAVAVEQQKLCTGVLHGTSFLVVQHSVCLSISYENQDRPQQHTLSPETGRSGIIRSTAEYNRSARVWDCPAGEQFAIHYGAHAITLQVPKQVAAQWTGTEMVGFEEAVDTGKGTTVKVLVEKDFACLDKGEVENEGTYPNPKAAC
jgi:hypothetical protein